LGLCDVEIEDAVGGEAHGQGGPEDYGVEGDVKGCDKVTPDEFEGVEVGFGGYGEALREGGGTVADYAFSGWEGFSIGWKRYSLDFVRGGEFLLFGCVRLGGVIVHHGGGAVDFGGAPEFCLWEEKNKTEKIGLSDYLSVDGTSEEEEEKGTDPLQNGTNPEEPLISERCCSIPRYDWANERAHEVAPAVERSAALRKKYLGAKEYKYNPIQEPR